MSTSGAEPTGVQADLARGDLGSARRRLASAVGSGAYDPELLARIAELSVRMGDPVQAGRYWLLTPSTGQEVEAAIEAFARQCHHDGRTMAWELPRFGPATWRARRRRAGVPERCSSAEPLTARSAEMDRGASR
jgi:hypothetical protein